MDKGEEAWDSVNWIGEGEDGVGRESTKIRVEKVLEIIEV